MNRIRVVDVAVERASIQFDLLFSYAVPDKLFGKLQRGQRVFVPFGSGDKKRQAMIMEVDDRLPAGLKEVADLIDETPVLTKEQIRLVYWLRDHTFCTYYDGVRLLFPPGLGMKAVAQIALVEGVGLDEFDLLEQPFFHVLSTKKKPISKATLLKKTGNEATLLALLQKGLLVQTKDYRQKVKDETTLMVSRTGREIPLGKGITEKQGVVLQLVEENQNISLKELLYYSGLTRSVVDTLAKKGFLLYQEEESFRQPLWAADEETPPVVLSDEQVAVLHGLEALQAGEKAETALLFGVTGSGKTQVFLSLIAGVLAKNQQVIVLVPEIALTPQTLRLFRGRFGDRVAVLHSRLSMGERLDEYKRIKQGKATIAVGTRSAVFAPFENLGLIVIDEEQESTYKSDSAPRYHARDVARFRLAGQKGLLLLASATPSLETYHAAKTGKIHLLQLPGRFGKAQLPDVVVVDMGDEKTAAGAAAVFSPTLVGAVEQALDKGEQSILLLNRRGYETVVVCGACKQVVLCPHCSVSLTYHQTNAKLVCHLCGWMAAPPKACPHCHEEALVNRGLGTQKAEEQLGDIFPEARILRMDLDTTLAKNAHAEKLEAFRQGQFDIMLGTQMVAKGLDFPGVTVVGVLLADQTLYAEDFRSDERGFSLLTQVVGRGGRGEKKGLAIIQTYTPYHEVIRLAADQDYEGFYACEIAMRKTLLYPPFASFAVAGFTSTSDRRAKEAAACFMETLKVGFSRMDPPLPIRTLGPTPSAIARVAGKYRHKLVIKCVDHQKTRDCLRQVLERYAKKPASRGVSLFLDLHYYGTL